MTYQQQEEIVQRLKTIDQYDFEVMVDSLLHQGAFPEIVSEGALVEPFGINMEKKRTIKSAPRADAEIRSHELKIESSTQENWIQKLKEILQKNKGKGIKHFAFFTNQDIGTKQIPINKKSVNAEKYTTEVLGCEHSWIVGQKDLVLPMMNPKYFNIRMNCLNMPSDFFCSVVEYRNILERNPSLNCETRTSDLERYGTMVRNRLSFDSSSVVLLNNNDYITLLHSVGAWAIGLKRESPQDLDFCFIRWPRENADTSTIGIGEVSTEIQTFMIVWGAHEIDNLSEYLRFAAKNIMLIFVTQTGFKEAVRSKLEASKGNIRVEEVSIGDIDERPAEPEEKAKHQQKISTIVHELLDLMLKYEALVYFYSPFNLDDQQVTDEILAILKIDNTKLYELKDLLIKSDLAAITGKILWLKQPVVAKELLNDFISKDIISISDLVTGS